MKRMVTGMLLLGGMLIAGGAQASKLCADSKAHEYLIVQNKMYSGDLKKYLEIMASVGVGPNKASAKKALEGKMFKCQKEDFCVQSAIFYRGTPNSSALHVQAFCRPLTKDEERI